MPAYNTAAFIATAVQSVLAQKGVELELVVVDDASTDETAAVVQSVEDSRVRLLQNPERLGIGYSHNRVLAETDAPYVAHVDSDDIVRPGALRTLLSRIQRSPELGQVYCNFYQFRSDVPLTRDDIRRQIRTAGRLALLDVRRALIVHGMVANHLRVYRRTVLDALES